MEFKDFFKPFQNRKDKIKELEQNLESDYIQFVNENRKEIKKYIPAIGAIVKYIGPSNLTYDGFKWEFLKIIDNRIISKPEYNSFIPKISVIPLDGNYNELKSYNERIEIDQFEVIDKAKQTKVETIGYVYLLNVINTDIYKIGYSKNADKRIGSIKTSSPLDIELIKVFKCYDAFQAEQELHNIFKGKRTNREWFKLNFNDLDILKKFLSDFLIEEAEDFLEDKLQAKEKNVLPLDSYEIEKNDIRNEFNKLMEKYIANCKVASVGDQVLDKTNQQYMLSKISIWDKLESKDKKPHLNYEGYRILKSGKKAKYSPFIFLKGKLTSKIDEDYKNEKRILLNNYKKLKKDYSANFHQFKKGDKVIDIFENLYIIDNVEFHDSFEWTAKAYFTYSGRKILTNGKLSEKYASSLHSIRLVND